MHKTITVDGQEYELQITARRVINDGRTAVSMDNAETEALLSTIKDDLCSIVTAIDYAVEQREYEASFETDKEAYQDMMNAAKRWENISDRLYALLDD